MDDPPPDKTRIAEEKPARQENWRVLFISTSETSVGSIYGLLHWPAREFCFFVVVSPFYFLLFYMIVHYSTI